MEEKSADIIICDDDPVFRQVIESGLSNSNYSLRVFEDGAQAIEAVKEKLPDLVISDVKMPNASGYEVCKQTKELSKGSFVPVILLTSLKNTEHTVSGFESGADDYITKPVYIEELRARVGAMLRIKQLTDNLNTTKNLLAEKEKELVALSVVGACAHELGQPITSIGLNCDLLKNTDQGSSQFGELIDEIMAQSNRLKAVLKKLSELENYSTTSYPGETDILDLGN